MAKKVGMLVIGKSVGGLVGEPTLSETSRIMQAPQSPNDRHGEKYDNDAQGWVRGVGTPYPHFDKKNAWRGGKLRED